MKILTFMWKRYGWKQPEVHVLRQLGVPQEIVWMEKLRFNVNVKHGRRTLQALSTIPRLMMQIKSYKDCDIVFVASDFWCEVLAFIVAKLMHKPYAIRMRGDPFIVRKILGGSLPIRVVATVYNEIEKFLFRHASLVIACTHDFENLVKPFNPNVVTVWNGMEDEYINAKQESPNMLQPVFGYLGRISREKGIQELFTALENLPLKFLVYARKDWDIPFPKNVKYMGFLPHDKVFEAYRNIDVLVLASHTEGIPRVLMESMFLGKAVIVTPVGDNKLIVDEKGGWICTHKTLKQTILEASKKSKKEILEMGLYNQAKARMLWGSWQDYKIKVVQLLESCLK